MDVLDPPQTPSPPHLAGPHVCATVSLSIQYPYSTEQYVMSEKNRAAAVLADR